MERVMMELGNMMFGNARGSHPVNRDLQDAFCGMLRSFGFDGNGQPWEGDCPQDWSEIPSTWGYTNGVFSIRPYWWGDCRCGWEAMEFDEPHRVACYQSQLRAIKDACGPEYYQNPEYARHRDRLCEKMGLDPLLGSGVHCTCDYPARYEQWFKQNALGEEGHDDACPIVLPNFEHHPSGFKLRWYKYALRDSYSNRPLTHSMIDGWRREAVHA